MSVRNRLHLSWYNFLNNGLLACIILLNLYLVTRATHVDAGIYLTIADEINNGYLPYVDYFYAKTPGIIYVLAGILEYSRSILAGKIAVLLSNLLTAAMIGYVSYRYEYGNAVLAATLYLAGVVIYDGVYILTEPFMMVFMMASVVAYVEAKSHDRLSLAVLSGICIGIAALFKQPALAVLPSILVYELFTFQRYQAFQHIRRYILVLIGSVLPIGVAVAYLSQIGILEEMVFQSILAAFQHSDRGPAIQFFTHLKFENNFENYQLIWLLSLAAMFYTFAGDPTETPTINNIDDIAALWVVFSFPIMAAQYMDGDSMYFLVIACLGIVGLYIAVNNIENIDFERPMWVFLMLFIASIAVFISDESIIMKTISIAAVLSALLLTFTEAQDQVSEDLNILFSSLLICPLPVFVIEQWGRYFLQLLPFAALLSSWFVMHVITATNSPTVSFKWRQSTFNISTFFAIVIIVSTAVSPASAAVIQDSVNERPYAVDQEVGKFIEQQTDESDEVLVLHKSVYYFTSEKQPPGENLYYLSVNKGHSWTEAEVLERIKTGQPKFILVKQNCIRSLSNVCEYVASNYIASEKFYFKTGTPPMVAYKRPETGYTNTSNASKAE